MANELILKAPAKVNLYLEVQSKRPDGYHEIISIFQMVSLYDILQFRSLKKENALYLKGSFNIPESKNIITKAVRMFREETGLIRGVQIIVEKRIPQGAGLGGGSSDAAATLSGLNRLAETKLSGKRLLELAASLGSDVPFFLSSAAAFVRGRGEVIEVLKPRSDYFLIIVYPGIEINTEDAYSWYDEQEARSKNGNIRRPRDEIVENYLNQSVGKWYLYNSFQSVLEQRFPQIKSIIRCLKELGADGAGISGSGSAVMGIFSMQKGAERALKELKGTHPMVAMVNPLEKMPYDALE